MDETASESMKSRATGRTLAFGALIAGVAAFTIWCYDRVKYDYFPKNFGEVVPKAVYRSGQISPAQIGRTLQNHSIGVIINLQHYDPTDAGQLFEEKVARERGVDYYRIAMSGDGTGEPEQYAKAIELINQCVQRRRPVLVHCGAGAERTGGVIAAYSLLVRHRSPGDVVDELRRYGSSLRPGSSLLEFLNSNLHAIADRLVERSVLPHPPIEIPTLKP